MAQDVAEKIRAAAVAKGIDPDTALRIAGVESGYEASAKNPRSSAKGLFQVTDDTWKRYHGAPGKQRDPDENIRVGMEILADNTNKLSKILGRAPRPSELYTAHFFGSGTGAEVLRADPDTPINRIASKKVMAANPHLKGLTVGELMAKHEAKFARTPGTPAYTGKKGGERQDDTQQMMTDALSSGQTAEVRPTVLDDPRIKALGTNYQMALAATTLADKNDDPNDDGMTESERFETFMEEKQAQAARAAEPDPARKALASFDLTYKSPFVDEAPVQQAPLQMAFGGSVAPPSAGIRPSEKRAIESANAEWEKYKQDVDTYNKNADAYNAWYRDYDATVNAPRKHSANSRTPSLETRHKRYIARNPQPVFDPAAQPVAPGATPQDLLAKAQRGASNRQLALTAFFEPEKFNLSFSHGGAVHRAGGSPEEGEHLTPQQIEQIAQRQQDARDYNQRMLEAPTRADTYAGFFKGVTQNLMPNVVGIPVDLTTMALRPFGYKEEKPVMGSEWLKDKATEYGMRPEPPKEGTNERNFYDVGNFASFFVNPASATRKIATTGEKLVEKGAQAAEKGTQSAKNMLSALKKPKEVPQTVRPEPTPTRVEPTPTPVAPPAVPVQQAQPLPPPPPEVNVPPEMQAPPPAMTQLPVPTPVAPPMQAGVPADRPFVGRLDAFVDTIKNPVQLGQLKGQLKGKFRDYDIERVERAFAGMDDKTKLTPDQIKQALAGTHSPTKWISETLPPEPHKYHQTMDNVWGKELGTTNLYLEQPEKTILATKLFDEGGTSLGAFVANSTLTPDMKKLEDARKMLSNPDLTKVADPELVARVSSKLDRAEDNIKLIDQFTQDIKNIERGFTRPVLFEQNGENVWFKLKDNFVKQKQESLIQQFMAQGRPKHEAILESGRQLFSDTTYPALNREAEAFASSKVQELAREQANSHSIDIPNMPIYWNDPAVKTMEPIGHLADAQMQLKNALEPSIQTVHEQAKKVQRFMSDDVKKLGLALQDAAAYRGKHKYVAAGPYPVGFTRFSEHEATIPGMGTVQGRHFHELQSDLSKDMRKSGTVGGSAAKDTKELDSLRNQIEQHRNQTMDQLQAVQKEFKDGLLDRRAADEKSQKIRLAMENKISPLEHRAQTLHQRTRDGAPYSLQEPFAGFEGNQMVRQQLLMKNAIQAAMRDGKSFATFPGNESAKPQLYAGKVLPNLKQVIKDLGGEKAGFELRQIELPPDKHGNPITATGVVWSPEAAARIVEKGVPFAKGGMVERNSADNRRYL